MHIAQTLAGLQGSTRLDQHGLLQLDLRQEHRAVNDSVGGLLVSSLPGVLLRCRAVQRPLSYRCFLEWLCTQGRVCKNAC